MRRWIGRYLLAYGALHLGVGAVLYARPLRAIVADGAWNAVEPHPDRAWAFWYMVAGLVVLLLGALVDWLEARGVPLPRRLGAGFLALMVLGGMCIPESGFWLLAPVGIALVRRRATAVRSLA